MPKKQLTGVEIANTVMLKEIAYFLANKKFYGKDMPKEEQEKKAAFDVSKKGELYKLLEKAGIHTKYEMAIEHAGAELDAFGDYAKVMKAYRTAMIRKFFSHRKDECK